MRQRFLYALGILFIGLSFIHFACQKEAAGYLPEAPTPSQTVTLSLSGRVVDEDNLPVSGASVQAGTANTTTDVNGVFSFTDVRLDKNAAYVKVEKSGYFLGSRTFTAKANSTHFVEIELIPKAVAGTFTAATGGAVNVPNGGSIDFSGSSIINESTRAAYTGDVFVSAYLISPTAANFSLIMPGDLRGYTTANEERALQSYGMMAVELIGTGGEKLNLASGKTAKITMPIPASMLAAAPLTIPLWYFDEAKGLWKEEGVATKQGANYVGTVSHFSFWNCDAPFPLVNFEALIKDGGGTPVRYSKVVIKMASDTGSTSGSGYTDSAGRVSGKIPANTNLELVVYNQCNSVIHTQAIGPFNADANLGTITIGNTGSTIITYSGTVLGCNNSPVTNGFVNVLAGGRNYRAAITNGTYTITIAICAGITSAELTAVDVANDVQGAPLTAVVTGGAITSNLTACGTSTSQFINYTLNGTNYSMIPPADSLNCSVMMQGAPTTNIKGYNVNATPFNSIAFDFSGVAVGSFPMNYLSVFTGNKGYNQQGAINVTLTEYGAPTQFIAGSFTGQVSDSTNTYPINCSFRVRRQY